MWPERTPRTLEQTRDSVCFVVTVPDGKALMTDYAGDRLLRQAVERNLEIVGETVGCRGHDNSAADDIRTVTGTAKFFGTWVDNVCNVVAQSLDGGISAD